MDTVVIADFAVKVRISNTRYAELSGDQLTALNEAIEAKIEQCLAAAVNAIESENMEIVEIKLG